MIDDVEAARSLRIVGAADIDQLLKLELVAQEAQHIENTLGIRLQRQVAEGDLPAGDRAVAGGADRLAEFGEFSLADRPAHRSIVPVRRIFFCSCRMP